MLTFHKVSLLWIVIIFSSSMIAQATLEVEPSTKLDKAGQIAFNIDSSQIKKHLLRFASDEFEGRETGTIGQQKAAQYIAQYFDKLGLEKPIHEKSYEQVIGFSRHSWEHHELRLAGKSYRNLWDYYSIPHYAKHGPLDIESEEVVFLGYGIESENYNDYRRAKVKDKVILILSGEPIRSDSTSLVTKSVNISDWSTDLSKKLLAAKKHEARAVLIVDKNFNENIGWIRNYVNANQLRMETETFDFPPHAFISAKLLSAIIGDKKKKYVKARDKILKKGKLKPVKLKTDLFIQQNKKYEGLKGSNVLGLVNGSDPQKKDELIVVSAHYDHLGKKGSGIYHGADDNASGSSTVLELARVINEASNNGQGPKRSILFLLVSGEEKGLLGSEYYSENPIYPLKNTVANVNVDMIGRRDKKHQSNPDYIYVIGADRLSTDLHNINENMNATYTQLELDYTYNDENDPNRYYYRSDHYNFAKKGIPAIFYFSGVHEDYHKTTDTADKIEYGKVAKVSRLIFHTIWELANRDARIVVDKS